MISEYLAARRAKRELLLMTHIVIGYPDLDTSLALVETMVEAGVDLMELQIPFSEPMADGPVILAANQAALRHGVRFQDCLHFAEQVTARFPIPFLFMSYYNSIFVRGVERFVAEVGAAGIRGAIVPDLPFEEGAEYLGVMQRAGLSPIQILSPNTAPERLLTLGRLSRGFAYVVARKGVTGKGTNFSEELIEYLDRCRRATSLPLAVGFGVRERADLDFLRGRVEVAVIGSETLRVVEREGVGGVRTFLKRLLDG
jgi:tryptophan synthase alpha chain